MMDPYRNYIQMTRLLICICLAACFATAEVKNVCTGDPNQWKQIFDGKDLNGWKHVGPAE